MPLPRRCCLFLVLLLSAIQPAVGDAADWRIVDIYDGDTIYVEAPELPKVLRRLGLRLAGIDAPELGARAKCAAERALALRARDLLRQLIAQGAVTILPTGWDKYGGRVDAVILVDGRSLAEDLIKAGLAHRYDGTGKRASWC